MVRTSMTSIPFWLVVLLSVSVTYVAANSVNCKESCGNVSIPFPFGIGADCFLNPWFKIHCKDSNGSSKPFLSKFQIEIKIIDFNLSTFVNYMDKYLTVLIPPSNSCAFAAQTRRLHASSVDLRGSPFYFSPANYFVAENCPGSAVMVNESKQILAGCGTTCVNNIAESDPSDGCNGVKCCHDQPDLGYPLQFYQIEFETQSQNCLLATLASSYHRGLRKKIAVPVQLSWLWSNYTFKKSSHSHSTCFIDDIQGVICNCDTGYQGDPFLVDGCQVFSGCKDCNGYCYEDDNNPHCYEEVKIKKPLFTLPASLGLSISFGITLLVLGFYGLYRYVRMKRGMKRRAKFFKHNGGLLMQQQLSSEQCGGETTKIFTPAELEKATDRFSENRILGQGGQGTVYKGMLDDGRIVAIKKSKLVDGNQVEQFINEVVILSQINHRNVVKLLGCCLETEVPLLVYEFIPNGTLSQYLHKPNEEFIMSWDMRIKIAADSASAIAYLHSSSSTPIYHRDIKSANILLDERYRAKVADFGCSKTIGIDQTHLTTLVQGTWGYLDPEYFQSSQFTEKSDVYSFGVVLLELLTSKKPIYRGETNEHKSLVIEFQNSQTLFNMLDHEVVKEVKEEDLTAILVLTKRCLSWNGKLRPTMKEVAMTLEMIVKSEAQEFTLNKQGFEDVNLQISDNVFMSNPLHLEDENSLYINVQTLMGKTL